MKKLKGQDSVRAGMFEYYETSDGWRWRLVAANHQIIANGGEAYSSKQKVIDAIHRVIDYSATVMEDRPEKLTRASTPGRAEILCGCGTQIIEVNSVDE